MKGNVVASFALILALIAIILVVIVIVMIPDFSGMSIDKILSIIGLVITALAFAVSTYLVLVAVQIYSYVRDIEKVRDSVNKIKTDSLQTLDNIKTERVQARKERNAMMTEMLTGMDEFLSHEISRGDPKRREGLYRARCRLALKYNYLDEERRINLIREVLVFGEKDDIPKLLRKVAENETESEQIRKMAKTILSELEKI